MPYICICGSRTPLTDRYFNSRHATTTGHGSRRRANAQSDSHDCYALSFQFPNGTIMAHTGEHMPNHTGFRAGCTAYGQTGYLEAVADGQKA